MKAKILPYFCFFLATLGFAWYASIPNNEAESSGREWVNLSKASLQKITFEDESETVTASRDPAHSDLWWMNVASHKKQGDQATESNDRFLINEKMNELMNGLSPFRIEKHIGAADKVNLGDFGLDKPTSSFEVNYGDGQVFSLSIGKRSFQSQQTFVLDKQKSMVLMVDRRVIAMLEKPKARMALIKPFNFDDNLLLGADLSAGGKALKLKRKMQAQQAQWFVDNKMDVPHEAFRNWLDKLLKLRIEGYPKDEQKLALEKLEGKFVLKFLGDKGELDSLTLLEESSVPPRYWFKTSKLPVPVMVDASRVLVLLNDMTAFIK